MKRILSSAALAAFLLAASGIRSPAPAYEVFLDYRGQTTVVGPTYVWATLYVRILPGEPAPARVQFRIDWDCVAQCTGSISTRGNAEADPTPLLPFAFSYLTRVQPCYGITCECLTHEWQQADVNIPLEPGVYPLAAVIISRTGGDTTCEKWLEYAAADFRVGCGNDPACSGGNVFQLQANPIAVKETTWGALKTLYR